MKNRFALLAAAALLSALACSPKIVLVKVQDTGEVKPGQKNFGGGTPADTAGLSAMKAFMREPEIRTVHFNDLAKSDPYIYAEPSNKTYYLTSSGGRMYRSRDLVMWEGPLA